MDARTLASSLDDAARSLGSVARDLSEAGFGLGQAVARTVWEGRAADAACGVLAEDLTLLAGCALAADRAARSASLAALDAWTIVAALGRLP